MRAGAMVKIVRKTAVSPTYVKELGKHNLHLDVAFLNLLEMLVMWMFLRFPPKDKIFSIVRLPVFRMRFYKTCFITVSTGETPENPACEKAHELNKGKSLTLSRVLLSGWF